MPAIALTPGEPAGIGPDLAVILAQQQQSVPLIYIADPDVLHARAQQLGLPFSTHLYESIPTAPCAAGEAWVLPVKVVTPVTSGTTSSDNSRYVINTLHAAATGCMKGDFTAMVTGPVHKATINQSGLSFSGHTEYLAELTGGHPVMMLANHDFRVALVTTHLPLKDVASAITTERLEKVITTLHNDLKNRFGITQPRILVCGLNPHAGENGYLGDEEIITIEPLLATLRQQGMTLSGPLPADTLFTPKYLDNADAVLAMFHDQGLPVLKYAGFGNAVNITLGLPIVRTSVDHGTALDLAGTGKADAGSLKAAVAAAITMTRACAHSF